MVRVLLVEDNPGDIRLIQEMFVESGMETRFEVEPVSTLDDGIAAIRKRDFVASLLDLGLPDSQGLDTLRRIRSVAPSVPIVIVTGLEDEEIGISSLEAGAEDYVWKSKLSASLLVHAVTYALQRRMLTDAIRLRTEEAEEQKTRALTYFDLLAHDVANLISPILLICDLTRLERNVSPETLARAKMMFNQAERASSMIVDLRLLEELERTNPDEVESIDLIETISDLKKGILVKGQHPSVEFSLHRSKSDRVTVKGGRWTKRVVSHLLRSFVKHSKADEVSIQVTISPVEDPSGKPFWRMEVADDGLGFPDEIDSDSLFWLDPQKRFSRGVAPDLSFCARFVHHFGGEFSIRGKAKGGQDKGTVIILMLPRGE